MGVEIGFCIKLKQVKDVFSIENEVTERARKRGYDIRFLNDKPEYYVSNVLDHLRWYENAIFLKHQDWHEELSFDIDYRSKTENLKNIELITLRPTYRSLAYEIIFHEYDIHKFLDDLKYIFQAEKVGFSVEGGFSNCGEVDESLEYW